MTALLVGIFWLVVWCRRKIALMNKLRVSLDNRELGPVIKPEKAILQSKEKEDSVMMPPTFHILDEMAPSSNLISGARQIKTVRFNPNVEIYLFGK